MDAELKPFQPEHQAQEQQPTQGGSYVRNEDGSLTQVEGPTNVATEQPKE